MTDRTKKLLGTGAFLLAVLLILGLAGFNYLYNLGNTPLRDWDEARHGVSAYEMIQSGDYLVNTYLGENDYWNLKPPLSFWLVAAGYQVAGYNAWGLRLYAALSGIGVVLVCILLGRKLGGRAGALFAGIIAVTTYLFTEVHAMRNGDADALFVLLTTLSIYFLATCYGKGWRLALSVGMFSLAFLAKSWHALSMLAVIGLFWILSRSWRWMRVRDYLYAVAGLLPIGIWALARWQADGATFFTTMFEVDMVNRTKEAVEDHAEPLLFYFKLVWQYYSLWVILLGVAALACIAIALLQRRRKLPSLLQAAETPQYPYARLALWLGVLVPLVAFTFVPTKLFWYVFPLYPCVAVLCGAYWGRIFSAVKKRWLRWAVLGLAAIFVLAAGAHYQRKCTYNAMTAYTEPMEEALQALDRELVEGCRAFSTLSVYGNEGWDQDQALGAQLFCGMEPRQGSLKAFAWDYTDRAVILMRRDELPALMELVEPFSLNRRGGWTADGVEYIIMQKK